MMNSGTFEELLESVQEMDDIARGKKRPSRTFRFPEPEVKRIREQTGLSQTRFARVIGVSKRTLENWEQGRRRDNREMNPQWGGLACLNSTKSTLRRADVDSFVDEMARFRQVLPE
jgi:putative transcriptional regulator